MDGPSRSPCLRLSAAHGWRAVAPVVVALLALTPSLVSRPTHAQTPPPDLLLLVTVRANGALARDGVSVRAQIAGQDCGGGRTQNGSAAFSIGGALAPVVCTIDGSDITFTVDGQETPQPLIWPSDRLAVTITLVVPAAGGFDGRVVRPLIEPLCRTEAGLCAAEEQALWSGSLSAWRQWLTTQGRDPAGDLIWRTWLRLRAERGEVFGSAWLAAAEGRPYSYIAAVQYRRGVDGTDPHVLLAGAGPARAVGGWSLRANTGHVYTFPPDAVLAARGCAVFFSASAAAANRSWACPGEAVFRGAGVLPAAGGEVILLDDGGGEIDAVAW